MRTPQQSQRTLVSRKHISLGEMLKKCLPQKISLVFPCILACNSSQVSPKRSRKETNNQVLIPGLYFNFVASNSLSVFLLVIVGNRRNDLLPLLDSQSLSDGFGHTRHIEIIQMFEFGMPMMSAQEIRFSHQEPLSFSCAFEESHGWMVDSVEFFEWLDDRFFEVERSIFTRTKCTAKNQSKLYWHLISG